MRVTQQRVAEIMNKGRFGDRVSMRVDFALSLLILANLIAVCLESVDSIAAIYGPQLLAFEMTSVSIFAAEYVLRLWSAPKRTDLDGETASAKRLTIHVQLYRNRRFIGSTAKLFTMADSWR